MRSWTCDLCGRDISEEAPPFSQTLALRDGVVAVIGGAQTESKNYLDWCHSCVREAVRVALNKEWKP